MQLGSEPRITLAAAPVKQSFLTTHLPAPLENVAPIVTIALGNGSYIDAVDTDGGVYEVVSLKWNSDDSDGSIATLEWSTTLYDKYEEKLVTLTAAGADADHPVCLK